MTYQIQYLQFITYMLTEIAKQQQQLQTKFHQLVSKQPQLKDLSLQYLYDQIQKYLQIDSSYRYKLLKTMKLLYLPKYSILKQNIISQKQIHNYIDTPKNQHKQWIYSLISGNAIIKKSISNQTMIKQSQSEIFQQNNFKLFSVHGLYNYKYFSQKWIVEIVAIEDCKFICIQLPQNLTYGYQMYHRKKKQFLLNFFGIEKLLRKYNNIFDSFKYVKYTKGHCLCRQHEKMTKLLIVEKGTCSYFKNIYIRQNIKLLPIGKLYNLYKRGEKALIGGQFVIQQIQQGEQFQFNIEQKQYTYQFKKNPKFNIFVQSAELQGYQIQFQQLNNIGTRQLTYFKKLCLQQVTTLQSTAHERLKKHIQVLSKIYKKQQNEKQIVQSQANINHKKQFNKKNHQKYKSNDFSDSLKIVNSSNKLNQEDFDNKIHELLNSKVKQERSQNFQRKIIMNLCQFNKAQNTTSRMTEFKNILNEKIEQKQKIVQNYIFKIKQLNKQKIDMKMQQQFKHRLLQIINKSTGKHNSVTQNQQFEEKTTSIQNYKILLDKKQQIMKQKLKNSNKEPLLLLNRKSTPNLQNKTLKIKLSKNGMGEAAAALTMSSKQFNSTLKSHKSLRKNSLDIIQHTPTAKKIQRIKQNITKKIDNSNKIKEQYMIIKSEYQNKNNDVELNVIKGYQSMKMQQKSKKDTGFYNSGSSTNVQNNNEDTHNEYNYNYLLSLLKKNQRKQEQSLQKVHQRARFLRKSTLQKYNHQQHLRNKMKLQRYSLTSNTLFRKQRKKSLNDLL